MATTGRVERWNLLELDAPDGTRDPVVLGEDDGARAVLVVLTPGQELGEHQVRENAWVVVLDGRITCRTAGEDAFELAAGGLARWQPGERHMIRTDDGARVLLMLTPWPGAGHYPSGAAS